MRTLIAGGGTGGHLTPALAVAQACREVDPSGAVLIVGRKGGVAEKLVADAGFELQTLSISGLDLRSFSSVVGFGTRLPAAVLAARRILKQFRADVVVGAAGYVCVPVVLAARQLRIPVVLLEQNALPGRAVRLLSRRAALIATSFEETQSHLHWARCICTGNPVRSEVLQVQPKPLSQELHHVVIMGGSQGARRINTAVFGMLERALVAFPELRITHQTGAADNQQGVLATKRLPEELRARYVQNAFFDPLADVIADADLVIMRAGGSSLAEVSVLGRPMILVPYAHAGGHQAHNAKPYIEAGAALRLPDDECTDDRLLAEIKKMVVDSVRWHEMAQASAEMARPQAAADVVRLLQDVAGKAAA